MKTIVFKHCIAELTEETYNRFQAEFAAQQEEDEIMTALAEGMHKALLDGDWSAYSDLHKDYYGVRPIKKYL